MFWLSFHHRPLYATTFGTLYSRRPFHLVLTFTLYDLLFTGCVVVFVVMIIVVVVVVLAVEWIGFFKFGARCRKLVVCTPVVHMDRTWGSAFAYIDCSLKRAPKPNNTKKNK